MNCFSPILCCILLGFQTHAQEIVTLSESSIQKTEEDQLVSVTFSFEILNGYHIQSETNKIDEFIATEIRFEDSDAFIIESFEFISKQLETLVFGESVQEVLINNFEVTITLKINEQSLNNHHDLRGELYYQPCTDRHCLFPRTLKIQVSNIEPEICNSISITNITRFKPVTTFRFPFHRSGATLSK